MKNHKKLLICITAVLLVSLFVCFAVFADSTSYNVAFTASSEIYTGTHIYGHSTDTYYFDNNTSANYYYSGSRAYCVTHGQNASDIAYPGAGGYDTAELYDKHRTNGCYMRYKGYNNGNGLCIASGRYGVD